MNCSVCGEPMPAGEEMFKFHGYSGPCPKPPLAPKIDYDGIALEYAKKLEAIFTDQRLVPPQRLARAQLVVIGALKRFVPLYGSASTPEEKP
jgi:hypothetical protein